MKPLLCSGVASLLLVFTALAEHRDYNGRGEGPRVIIYQHAGYGGDALVLYPGESIDNLSGKKFERGAKLNDSISSIRVEGGAEVYAYADARYRGDALRLTENTRDLTGRFVTGSFSVSWNDRISSIRVERLRGRERETGRSGDYPRSNPEKIIKTSFNERLGREPDAGELRKFQDKFKHQGWTERMLHDHLRTEQAYRVEAADLIIIRAYRDTLGREVDESGRRTYRRNLLDRDWTESDVCDDLRKSAEYRNRPRN